jgi:coenzyme F420-0:L-glutamate ligase/coenzyme F420-1:gamma-L-glutamate ligase
LITLLPEDPRRERTRNPQEAGEVTGAHLAAVLADSEIMGTGRMDLAVGCSGIESVNSNFGRTGLYDEPKPMDAI